jgi:hypothetical protein
MLLAFTYQERMRPQFCGTECDKKKLGSGRFSQGAEFTILDRNSARIRKHANVDLQIAPEVLSAILKLVTPRPLRAAPPCTAA